MIRFSICIFTFLVWLPIAVSPAQEDDGRSVDASRDRPVVFNRDIRPLLVDRCFACHGPDAETVAGDLRVDIREDAIDAGAIVPGDPEESELIYRVFSDDEDELMPPPDSHKELSNRERELLRRWIADGAEYQPHWAYTKLVQPDPPSIENSGWVSNPIDPLVASKLQQAGVTPNERADRVTLIRRLAFDLNGIPPTTAEVDAFVNDRSSDAYEKLVDRLLESPRFGERMAIYWLDLVRYADTVGYHGDQDVSQTPYRDYVIEAFNSNMPYDQFVREQLAGDLIANATIMQQIASGYNRLNQTTEEGGAQPKEYLAIYFADRVRNVSQVFMGATVGCAQCHDHKFDPYTAKDFYSLGAFFADLKEVGKYDARMRPPMIRVLDDQHREQLKQIDDKIAAEQQEIESLRKQVLAKQPEWEQQVLAGRDLSKEIKTIWLDDQLDGKWQKSGEWTFVASDDGPVKSGARSRVQKSDTLVQHYFNNANPRVSVTDVTRFFTWVYLDPDDPPTAIMLQLNDGRIWDHRAVWGSDDITYGLQDDDWDGYRRSGELPESGKWVQLEISAAEIGLKPGQTASGMAFTQFGGKAHWDAAGWIEYDGVPTEIVTALETQAPRPAKQVQEVQAYYLKQDPSLIAATKKLNQLHQNQTELEESAPLTVVSQAVKPREIRILHRGNWMDESGEIVVPAIPEFLGKLDTGDQRASRLDLANWLCEPDNVLTSRTMANRLWYLMFGRGICASVDDFGGQGTYPSNPELLDWLAVEFVRSGWDIKHTLKTIVTSSTYRQSSHPTAELKTLDPYNDLFARQGRFRIDAEMVRDNALAISGLLVEKVGGVSANPYQPAGYYAQLNFPTRTYQADTDENQYRRGVYTHWQRTFLHPMLKAFDAPSREECTAARSRSNTPLQSLSLLNDPTFVEAARVFADRVMREGGAEVDSRIQWAFQTAVSHKPSPEIVTELKRVYESHLAQYTADETAAKQLISTGNAPAADDLNAAELAAWTSVARVILNLHEVITRY